MEHFEYFRAHIKILDGDEYEHIEGYDCDLIDEEEEEYETITLDYLGSEGWELVCCVEKYDVAIFKRPY